MAFVLVIYYLDYPCPVVKLGHHTCMCGDTNQLTIASCSGYIEFRYLLKTNQVAAFVTTRHFLGGFYNFIIISNTEGLYIES